jgi:osmoprotectant transport system ATP-binding protein
LIEYFSGLDYVAAFSLSDSCQQLRFFFARGCERFAIFGCKDGDRRALGQSFASQFDSTAFDSSACYEHDIILARQSKPTMSTPPVEHVPLVEFRDVTFAVKPDTSGPIIDRLSFSVEPGETLVLLGESGCGKTTTLRLVNRLLTPTSGQVLVEGKTTIEWDVIRLRRQTGYVIQEAGLFPHFTVAENVALVPSLENWDEDRTRLRVEELLSLVGLEPARFRDRYPRELSGGQRQRVGVARALAADPPLLLMDEPFGALDPLTRASLQKEFAQLKSSLGKTVVFVTHDVREALLLGSRIALMSSGKIVLIETPEGFTKSENELARAYLETLRADLVSAP